MYHQSVIKKEPATRIRSTNSPYDSSESLFSCLNADYKVFSSQRSSVESHRQKRKAIRPGVHTWIDTDVHIDRWTNNEMPYYINEGFSKFFQRLENFNMNSLRFILHQNYNMCSSAD